MRTLLNAVRLAALVVGAATVLASTANAQLEVVDEAGGRGAHCPPSACAIHMLGEWRLAGHVFGIESTVADCQAEMFGLLYEDGEGVFYQVVFSNHFGSSHCTQQPCDLAGWEIHAVETSPGKEVLRWEFCVEEVGGGYRRRCLVDLPIVAESNHNYEMVFQSLELEGTEHENIPNCELLGEFHFDGTGIEFAH